jgi:hypothetical protein
MKKQIPPLIIDKICDTSNLHFLSLIEYKRTEYIGIIDNITNTHVKAYVLDLAKPAIIDIVDFLSNSIKWFYEHSDKTPISLYVSQKGLTPYSTHMYKSFELNGVSRIVGNPFIFSHFFESSTRKRKVLPISDYIEIRLKKSNQNQIIN